MIVTWYQSVCKHFTLTTSTTTTKKGGGGQSLNRCFDFVNKYGVIIPDDEWKNRLLRCPPLSHVHRWVAQKLERAAKMHTSDRGGWVMHTECLKHSDFRSFGHIFQFQWHCLLSTLHSNRALDICSGFLIHVSVPFFAFFCGRTFTRRAYTWCYNSGLTLLTDMGVTWSRRLVALPSLHQLGIYSAKQTQKNAESSGWRSLIAKMPTAIQRP